MTSLLDDSTILAALIAVGTSVIGWILTYLKAQAANRDKDWSRVNERLDGLDKRALQIEVKLEPLWEIVSKELPKFLMHNPNPDRLRALLGKWTYRKENMTVPEAIELRDMLEEKKRLTLESGQKDPEAWLAALIQAAVNSFIVEKAGGKLAEEARRKWMRL